MLQSHKSTGLALTIALLLSQTIALADESSYTSIKSQGPLGSVSKKESVKTDMTGTSTDVQKESNSGDEAKSSSYHAEVGANGAEVSAKKEAVRANIDGSVTHSKQAETHRINAAGAAHEKSSASTTVGPDGSSTSVKEESASSHQ